MYVSKFRPDTAYGAEDISDIVRTLTGSGISPQTPNDILSAISDGGTAVTDEKCAVTFADTAKTKVRIGSGTVIMHDGSFLVTDGETLDIPTGETIYVYIRSDILEQNVPTCDAAAPNASDILLATVENGTISDSRVFAKSKIAAYGSNKQKEITYTGEQVKAFAKANGSTADDADRIFPLSSDTAYNYLILSVPTGSNGDHTLVIKLGEAFSFVGAESGETAHKITPYDTVKLDNEKKHILYSPYNSTRFYTMKALYV